VGRIGFLCLFSALAVAAGPSSSLSGKQRTEHLLSRATFGATGSDRAHLAKIGETKWLEEQLHPESIDDSALEKKLKAYPSLSLSMQELVERYPQENKKERQMQGGAEENGTVIAALREDKQSRPRDLLAELSRAKVLRAAESHRQLEEVLADFWFNHFNVDFTKGAVKWLITDYEGSAIRPHLFGKFRDLLLATAQHPAMLFYLDNFLNVRDGLEMPRAAKRSGGAATNKQQKRGINENYARELLELHTLGVDGGYTQKDVIEVARALTGWSIDKPWRDPAYKFRLRAHDPDPKTVLGHAINEGGEADGLAVIDLLATHPSTAHFLATKLCRRFVADDPPKDCVDEAAKRFLATGGDLRETYRAIFSSAAFHSEAAYRAKVKRPFEFVVSAVRALGASVDTGDRLPLLIDRLGEALYRCAPPTGYKDIASAWVSSGALVGRLNFAAALAADRIPGVFLPEALLRHLYERKRDVTIGEEAASLYGNLSGETLSKNSEAVIEKTFDRAPADDGEERPFNRIQLLGMLLGTPEFQRR
jgi:uncharacterized protein (DUF1800 family)